MGTGIKLHSSRVQATTGERHLLIPRLIAGLPLLLIGLAHVVGDTAPMRPLVEAAGFPAPALLSPVAVLAEIVAGALLLAGFYARFGALLALVTMTAAVYAHLAIDVWPNQAGEPPLALPLVVLAGAAYVLWRGAGAWSLDSRRNSEALSLGCREAERDQYEER